MGIALFVITDDIFRYDLKSWIYLLSNVIFNIFKRRSLISIVMKCKILILAVFLMSLGACTQKMCSTYAKKDVKQETKTQDTRI